MENKKCLVVIPTYNEIDNIERMTKALFDLYPNIHLLIIDDLSPDQTAVKVEQLQENYPNLFLIKRSGKLGIGTAYLTGFQWALEHDYELIAQMDCDFSHDPADLAALFKKAEIYDLVIGSRYINGIRIINWSFKRLLLSYLASRYVRFFTSIPIQDVTGGFKCFQAKALKSIRFKEVFSNGYAFQLEMNYRCWKLGLTLTEHPIIFYERREGESKMSWRIIIEAIFSVFRLRWMNLFR